MKRGFLEHTLDGDKELAMHMSGEECARQREQQGQRQRSSVARVGYENSRMVKERRAVQEPVTPAAPKLFLCL